jgi:hypothetical protein
MPSTTMLVRPSLVADSIHQKGKKISGYELATSVRGNMDQQEN